MLFGFATHIDAAIVTFILSARFAVTPPDSKQSTLLHEAQLPKHELATPSFLTKEGPPKDNYLETITQGRLPKKGRADTIRGNSWNAQERIIQFKTEYHLL